MKHWKTRTCLLWLVVAVGTASAASAADRCTEPVPANHCLIGTWQAESTNAPTIHNQAQGSARWAAQDMGANEFVFAANGTFSQETTRESTSRFEHRSGAASQNQTVKVRSKSTGRWSLSGAEGLILCKETFEMKMGEGDAATSLPPEVAAAETTGEIAYEFSCQGDTAELTLLMPGGPEISWTARRVDR